MTCGDVLGRPAGCGCYVLLGPQLYIYSEGKALFEGH